MKKRILTALCVATLAFGMTVTASANAAQPGSSKQNTANEDDGKKEDSPATGESNALIYGIAAAALLSGTAVVSKKRLEEAR